MWFNGGVSEGMDASAGIRQVYWLVKRYEFECVCVCITLAVDGTCVIICGVGMVVAIRMIIAG